YRTKLYKSAVFEQDPRIFSGGYIFWAWLMRDPIYTAASQFDIDHGLTIIDRHENYADFFHFGTSTQNPVSQDFFVSKLHVLYRFIALFKQKGYRLIKQAEDGRFQLGVSKKDELIETAIHASQQISVHDRLLLPQIGRFYFTKHHDEESYF